MKIFRKDTSQKNPRIFAVINEYYTKQKLLSLRDSNIHSVELRLDTLSQYSSENDAKKKGYSGPIHYLKEINNLGFEIMGTLRHDPKNCGGISEISKKNLYESYLEMSDFVDYFDLEIDLPPKYLDKILSLARAKKIKVLLSLHDYKKTPSFRAMKSFFLEARKKKADIFKIAVHANSLEDFQLLVKFAQEITASRSSDDKSSPSLVWISMGEHGSFSRIASLFLGSPFTYGYIRKANAPGQLSVKELQELLLRYHYGYRKSL